MRSDFHVLLQDCFGAVQSERLSGARMREMNEQVGSDLQCSAPVQLVLSGSVGFRMYPLRALLATKGLKSKKWNWELGTRMRKKFLSAGESCLSTVGPTPGFKGRTSVSSGSSTEGTLI